MVVLGSCLTKSSPGRNEAHAIANYNPAKGHWTLGSAEDVAYNVLLAAVAMEEALD